MSGACKHYVDSDKFGKGPITQCPRCSGYTAQVSGERESKYGQTVRGWTCRICGCKFITVASGPMYGGEEAVGEDRADKAHRG